MIKKKNYKLYKLFLKLIYEGHSKSNATYKITFERNI